MNILKVIGWAGFLLIGYFVLDALMPLIIWALVGLSAWYGYEKYAEHRTKGQAYGSRE